MTCIFSKDYVSKRNKKRHVKMFEIPTKSRIDPKRNFSLMNIV